MNINKEILRKKLIERNSFWSIKINQEIPDEILIEKTLIYLDIEDINILFTLYPPKQIKQVWRNRIVTQGDYYHRLNKLLAWMYFDIKNPDQYIKTTISKHIKQLV